jgi:hypothetical protein
MESPAAPEVVLPLADPREAGAKRPLGLAALGVLAVVWIVGAGSVLAYVVGGICLIGVLVSLVTWWSGRRLLSGHDSLRATSAGLSCPLWAVDFDQIREISIGRYAVFGQPEIVMGERVFDRPLEEVLAAINAARPAVSR